MASLGLTLGVLEIGVLISSTLYGVTSMQLYIYYKNGFKDKLWIKLLVALIWTFETLHTIFIWIYLYRLSVQFYGNPTAIGELHWTIDMSSVFDGIISSLVQAFFAYRVWVLSQKLYLPVMVWIIAVVQFTGTIAIYVVSAQSTMAYFAAHDEWIATATLCCNVFVDIVNAGALCYYLWRPRREVPRHTTAVVDKLIVWTIETGSLTAVAAIVMLITSLAMPDTFVWIGITLFYAKLYSNSLLASLNGRASLRAQQPSWNTLSGLSNTQPVEVHIGEGQYTSGDSSLSTFNKRVGRLENSEDITFARHETGTQLSAV
ncbi:hypothetical protein GGU10DRAFT_367470 [Lentinula aff. detonsa]|uniref:DUF6534 domain-containing protein n=1 Tax=Lentinula aff. detonsa TaxID=2804958 RepID=A0AA38L371_9AGAR|nr:hypothetical protein GGU10DRAFT_367470 [Lentinula aff. detonsa]